MKGSFERFVEGESDEWALEFDDPRREVVVREEGGSVTCSAAWGGWHWQAEGGDRMTAARRLMDRLHRVNPFDGFDTDWGDPGYQVDELDEAIPQGMRELMREWSSYEETRQTDLHHTKHRIVTASRDHEKS